MSGYVLKLFPTDPEFIPAPEVKEKVKELLVSYGSWAEDISIITTDQVHFVDQGENFEKVLCPFCSKELEIVWWQQAMNIAFQNKFKNLDVIVPCCAASTSLNELDYNWAAGFAKFEISVTNPVGALGENQIRVFEETLGIRLKKILAHY